MITDKEFTLLNSKSLSFQARSLYIFVIKPFYIQGFNTINLVNMCGYMENTSAASPYTPYPKIINQLLHELAQHHLLNFEHQPLPGNLDKLSFSLTQVDVRNCDAPQLPFKMHEDWTVSAGFYDKIKLRNIYVGKNLDKEIKAFIKYWCNHGDALNQSAWESRLIDRILRRHMAVELDAPQRYKAQEASLDKIEKPNLVAAQANSYAAEGKLQKAGE